MPGVCKKIKGFVSIEAATGQVCPLCQKDLVERRGAYGEFLGCSGFPACDFTPSKRRKLSIDERWVELDVAERVDLYDDYPYRISVDWD